MAARFQAAQLTPAECKRIQDAEELESVNEKDLERLLDFVHYGKFTGQQAVVESHTEIVAAGMARAIDGMARLDLSSTTALTGWMRRSNARRRAGRLTFMWSREIHCMPSPDDSRSAA